jgi:hypothetical protein
MEPEGSLPSSEESTIGTCPEPEESFRPHKFNFRNFYFNIIIWFKNMSPK